ncbi:antigen 5 like allergen Cul n 1-like isoform X2 [Toxorhynchites rutilus septentrionalis]|uniref:antigen 5 like allergen Cul n 1-like isoform X2 n=1 Tax=Toxorhynchites rutilus septentrionalis TaxID=329112 RepID=UPI002479DD4C|nr:antigen 5 like allergen Cul n 1-like isoform X2 [Toxorhynchites rutilus septentrionalis]
MAMFTKLIWLVMLLASLKQSYSADYCKHDLCGAGKAHIGCQNDGKLSPQCPKGAKVIKMTDELKQLVLDTHNKYRSELATGKVEWLPKAANMPSLTWDNELAKTAQMNANRCVRGHDACHNTEKYKNSGQNLNFYATTADTIDVNGEVPNLITSWWDERHDVNKNMVNTMYDPGKSIMVFHFAVMGSDKVNKVGCAITQWKPEKGWNQIYLVCNYSFNDFVGLPIYVAGEPCSQCTKGCNPKFEGLCVEDEPVALPIDYAV